MESISRANAISRSKTIANKERKNAPDNCRQKRNEESTKQAHEVLERAWR
jgi:hypothetical protein